MRPIRCTHCNTWIDPNDMLQHGIKTHNNPFAMQLQKMVDDLNIKGIKSGMINKPIKIMDILSEEEIDAQLAIYEREKESLR